MVGSASSPANHAPAVGSDISLCNAVQTDYAFYHREKGGLARAAIAPDDVAWRFETVSGTEDLATDSKLAVLCTREGATIVYQPESSSFTAHALRLSAEGEILAIEPVGG